MRSDEKIQPWVLCTDVPQFDALRAAAASFRSDEKLHLRNLCNDSARCAGLTAMHMSYGGRRVILDYSRQRVTGETMELLFDLADSVGFTQRRADFRAGAKINKTEQRAVLHHVLRMPEGYQFREHEDGATLLKEVHQVRRQIRDFSTNVRDRLHTGVSGKAFKNVICIGIGGSHLGAEFVYEALRADSMAAKASEGRALRFIANMDPVDFHLSTRDLDPAETLCIVVSKSFTTSETILNAQTVKKWLIQNLSSEGYGEKDIIGKHMLAVSSHVDRCAEFGIPQNRVFCFWDFVCGRYSVCSAVGLLPLSLHYSYAVMEQFLNGAHDMDEHFFSSPLRDNIPLILGLIGVWNSSFLGYGTRAILPYSQALNKFPAHVQQVDMESNGKRVAMDGSPMLHPTGEITFGECGTNGQHSFYQLLHQGRVVPADFIGFMESQQDVFFDDEVVSNHDELMSNFFAQPDALAYGKTVSDLIQEGVPEELHQHMAFPGNRPSSSILMTRLDAFAVGQLLAIYEHRCAVQGFVWGLNSFDQFGVELGKILAKQVRTQMSSAIKTGGSVQGFNGSTSYLLDAYVAHNRRKFQQG